MLRLLSVLLLRGGRAIAAFAGLRLLSPGQAVESAPVEVAAAEMPPAPESASVTPPEEPGFAAPVPAPVVAEPIFETAGTRSAPRRDPAETLREVPIAHESPDVALMGEAFEVTLAIDATGAASAARTLPNQGNVVEGEAMVGDEAKALLTGTNFEIEALSPETQTLSQFASNTWRWQVKATAEGQQDLVLEIFAMDGERALPVRSYRDTVTIQVTTVGRLVNAANEANPIVMLLGGIGSILGGAIGVFRFFRR